MDTLVRQHCIINSETRLLDFGCGTHGNVAREFCGDVRQVVGVDNDPQAVAAFNQECNDQGLEKSEICAISNLDNTWNGMFSVIVASLVFHHIDEENHGKVLSQLRMTAQPGAQLVLIDLIRSDGVNGVNPKSVASVAKNAGWVNLDLKKGPKISLHNGNRSRLFILTANNSI